jgi:hypothetical protein
MYFALILTPPQKDFDYVIKAVFKNYIVKLFPFFRNLEQNLKCVLTIYRLWFFSRFL